MTALSVVVSTYERPDALDAVLWALSEQTDSDFDVVVADDGSGPETEAVVECWQGELGSRLAHVRQPDEGFRLALVRNRAARAARGDVLVFLDGDCVPRRGLVRALVRAARPGWFLGSRRLMLSEVLTARVLGVQTCRVQNSNPGRKRHDSVTNAAADARRRQNKGHRPAYRGGNAWPPSR